MTAAAGPSAWRARAIALAAAGWLVVAGAFYYRQIVRIATSGIGPWPMLDGPRDATLPHFAEALRSAMIALSGAGLSMAAAIVVGLAIVRRAGWEMPERSVRLPVAASLGIGVLAYVGFALAMLGAYRPMVLRGVVAVVVVTWLIARVRGGAVDRVNVERGAPPIGADRVWRGIAALALVCSLGAALAPVIDYDALWFHLHFPNVFLAHGRLVDLPAEYVSLYPMTWELWFGFGLALGGPTTATLLHHATLPLTAMLVFALTRRYARPASPWLAVALFVTAPTVLWEGTTPYVDLAFTMHVAVMLVALLRFHETRMARWLVLAAVSAGLALATKHVGLIVLALAGPAVAIVGWVQHRRFWPPVRAAVALGIVALVVPMPWYVRAAYLTGDPMFPELFPVLGAPMDRWDAQARAGLQGFFAGFGRTRTLAHQLTLPWDMTMHAERYGGTFGPLFLALVPLAALRLGTHRSAEHGEAIRRITGLTLLAAFTLGYLVLWASPIASFQLRWVLAASPPLAVLAAAGYERASAHIPALARRGPSALATFLAALLVLSLPPFTPLHEHERRDWESGVGWLTHVLHGIPVVSIGAEARAAYLRRHVPTYDVWTAARRALPPNARVLTWAGGDHLYGVESRIWVFAPVTREAASARVGEERDALRTLRRLGITHILIDKQFLRANRYDPSFTWESFALTNSRTASQHYDVLLEDARAVLYAIRWDSVGPA